MLTVKYIKNNRLGNIKLNIVYITYYIILYSMHLTNRFYYLYQGQSNRFFRQLAGEKKISSGYGWICHKR